MSISFASSFTQKTYSWTDWKVVQVSKNGNHQYSDDGNLYYIYFYDSPEVHICNIFKGVVPDGVTLGGYTQEQNDSDKADFEANYKSTANKPINKTDEFGRAIIVDVPRAGTETIYASCNFCDKCSWFGGSIRVNDETLTDNGDGYRFNFAHQFIIDMVSGRVFDDDGNVTEQQMLNPDDPHGYQVIINVDGYQKSAHPIFTSSGGDYEVFFEDGYVQFFESQAGKTVTASYSYADACLFVLKPLPGKKIDIEAAEADFSADIIFNDTIYYTLYGYVDAFAPQLMPGIPSGTLIPLSTSRYKRYPQILREAVGSYPTLDKNGATPDQYNLDYKEFRRQSRGIKVPSMAVPFRYATVRTLLSSAGMELRVGLENSQVFDGDSSTITFYCTAGDDGDSQT